MMHHYQMLSCVPAAAIRTLALLLIVAGVVARGASAHELGDRASPAPDSVVDAAPKVVEIAFPGLLADDGNRLVVQSQRGEVIVDRKPDVLRDAASSSFSIDLPETLADGGYIVRWTAVHADGRREDGTYVFTVRSGERSRTGADWSWLAWAGTAAGVSVIAIGGWWLVQRNGRRYESTTRT